VAEVEARIAQASGEEPGSPVAAPERDLPNPARTFALPATAALALSACGGGGTSTPAPAPPPAAVVVAPTRTEAARFLGQATMGATAADLDNVVAIGFTAWLDAQFAAPRGITHWDWLVSAGYAVPASVNSEVGFDNVMWRQLIASGDQLRQRVGMALLDFLVVGIGGVALPWRQFAVAAYADVLWDNAFGNFRTLLDRISTNVAMGYFLTFAGNRRANAATGAVPDENYARELMQLFTIGLVRLNPDGSVQMSGGRAVETYTQDDITGLARVFTGWNIDSSDNTTPDRMRRPMVATAGAHETGEKSFLGTTIPAGTGPTDSLRLALDAIFAHPNVAPFVSRQLIQRLVTSNPPPSYVARIATVFENNGSGTRGDLRAVVRAILTDVEARNAAIAGATSYGKLREPVMRVTGWARSFGATSPSGVWAIPDTSSTANRIGQSPGRAPSVFGFFRPGYTPPNSAIATAGLVAPEFQITNEPSVISYVNYMQALLMTGAGDVRGNYTDLTTRATDSTALVDEVDIRLGAQLSANSKASIRAAVDSIATTATNFALNRAYTAILLTMSAPEYLVQK
jgi:uncharacterized protein (DUF1800 family)